MNRLAEKVVLVTGGSRGIGEAITRLFAAEGAAVAFCARNSQRGELVETAIREQGGEATFTACDVSSPSEATDWVEAAVARYGRLDAVVNNAAATAAGPLEEMSLEEWEFLLRTNVTSMFVVTRAAIPHLRAAGGGSIVNVGSTYGVVGAADAVAYGMTKAAAISLSKGLALELTRDRIRVNALCPGGTETPFTTEWLEQTGDPEGQRRRLVSSHPMGRLATPAEQANAALFLVSDEASFVTGHAFLVDGGYTAQ